MIKIKVHPEQVGTSSKFRNNENEVELIDYKTGTSNGTSRTEIVSTSASLQLFLYAALMKSLGFKVIRAGILGQNTKNHLGAREKRQHDNG